MIILFIVTSFWAYGELGIACEFALRAREAGHKPYFIIPPSHDKTIEKYGFPYTTLLPKSGQVNRILLTDIELRLKPEIILLADFLNYNFCESHYGLTPDDLRIFSGKLGTFDNFDWVITGNQMDTYGFRADKFGEIDVRRYGFRLCPCPIVNPHSGERENTYHYSLFTQNLPYRADATKEWKIKIGLPTDKKLILFTHAPWQESYKQYPDVEAFVKASNEVFYYLIKCLAKEHTVLCIGAKGYFSECENDHILYKEQLPPKEFEQFLLATDLFISRNITSTSLARAVLSGIPSVNFSNSLFFSKTKLLRKDQLPFKPIALVDAILEKLERCYPYRMFPVGWYKFLAPVLKNNPYGKTLLLLEQFDVTNSLKRINELLEEDERKERLQQSLRQYKQTLNELPSVAQIIEKIKGQGNL